MSTARQSVVIRFRAGLIGGSWTGSDESGSFPAGTLNARQLHWSRWPAQVRAAADLESGNLSSGDLYSLVCGNDDGIGEQH